MAPDNEKVLQGATLAGIIDSLHSALKLAITHLEKKAQEEDEEYEALIGKLNEFKSKSKRVLSTPKGSRIKTESLDKEQVRELNAELTEIIEEYINDSNGHVYVHSPSRLLNMIHDLIH